jgi:hypothetical protein
MEEYVLRMGRPLNESQMIDARKAGVRQPERVRILSVPSMPFPSDEKLQQAIIDVGLLSNVSGAVSFGYGICLRERFFNNRFLLVHELFMVSRYEQLGGIEQFLRTYVEQSMVDSFNIMPMEREADQTAERICSENHS